MSALLLYIAFLGFVSTAAAQCSTTQNTNCVNWVRNGYCNNPGYTLAQKQATCGISCGLCTSAGVPITNGVCTGDANSNCAIWKANGFCTNTAYSTEIKMAYCCSSCAATPTTPTTPTDGNANCARWSSDPAIAYCASTTITKEQKILYCAKTCEFEITPNADCALYTLTGTTFARGTPSNRTNPAAPIASGAVAGTTTLSRAFAASGCTITLFTEAAGTTALAPTMVGTATTNFFVVDAANTGSLSYTCACA